MKKVQILSIVVVIVTIAAYVISTDLFKVQRVNLNPELRIYMRYSEFYIEDAEDILNEMDSLNNIGYGESNPIELEADRQREYQKRQDETNDLLVQLKSVLLSQNQIQQRAEMSKTPKSTFGMKEIISIIFCLAGLFVVLSNKYDADTKKWAFSILTLIAGVWVGGTIN